jgi:hypothetical protein
LFHPARSKSAAGALKQEAIGKINLIV